MKGMPEVIAISPIRAGGIAGIFAEKNILKVWMDRMEISGKKTYKISWNNLKHFSLDHRQMVLQMESGERISGRMPDNPQVAGLAWMFWQYKDSGLFEAIEVMDFNSGNLKLKMRSFLTDGVECFRDAGIVLETGGRKFFVPTARTVAVRQIQIIGGMKTGRLAGGILRFEPDSALLPLAAICQSLIRSPASEKIKSGLLETICQNHGACRENEQVMGMDVKW